jgi:hypothetical protein
MLTFSNMLQFSAGAERLRSILFHPMRTTVAIKAFSRVPKDLSNWETYIHIWDFQKGRLFCIVLHRRLRHSQ